MACKSCGDTRISSKFKCHACHIKNRTFKWCVITRADRKKDGNQYDETVSFDDNLIEVFDGSNKLVLDKKTLVHFKWAVFTQGEIFPVEPDFEREMCAAGRKANKWDIEYELFPASRYKFAVARAQLATDELYAQYDAPPPTALSIIEEKYQERLNIDMCKKELDASKDKVKTFYNLIYKHKVTLKEVRKLRKEMGERL